MYFVITCLLSTIHYNRISYIHCFLPLHFSDAAALFARVQVGPGRSVLEPARVRRDVLVDGRRAHGALPRHRHRCRILPVGRCACASALCAVSATGCWCGGGQTAAAAASGGHRRPPAPDEPVAGADRPARHQTACSTRCGCVLCLMQSPCSLLFSHADAERIIACNSYW